MAPVLVPSWRFFDTIAASPRLQYSPCDETGGPQGPWTEVLVSRPTRSTRDVLTELFFSPARNDALYLADCCDRVVEDGSRAAYDAVAARILFVWLASYPALIWLQGLLPLPWNRSPIGG